MLQIFLFIGDVGFECLTSLSLLLLFIPRLEIVRLELIFFVSTSVEFRCLVGAVRGVRAAGQRDSAFFFLRSRKAHFSRSKPFFPLKAGSLTV